MADLTITAADVRVVESIEQDTKPAAVDINAGQLMYLNTSGAWALADGSAASTLYLPAYAVKTVKAGQALTGLRKGKLYVGAALAGLAFGVSVYASDTAGTTADAAGTVSLVSGYVDSGWANGATADKLLRVDL